jgi:hypothetical protein
MDVSNGPEYLIEKEKFKYNIFFSAHLPLLLHANGTLVDALELENSFLVSFPFFI